MNEVEVQKFFAEVLSLNGIILMLFNFIESVFESNFFLSGTMMLKFLHSAID